MWRYFSLPPRKDGLLRRARFFQREPAKYTKSAISRLRLRATNRQTAHSRPS